MEHDQSGTFNRGLLHEVGKLGLIGITIPDGDGGANLTRSRRASSTTSLA